MPDPRKKIWYNEDLKLSDLDHFSPHTLSNHLGMKWLEIGEDFLKMSMPVDEKTIQPYGLLHGGASCALAETIGSVGSHLIINPDEFICVGLEINANHLRGARNGHVIATATMLHLGRTTHVWDIKIHHNDKLICISRLTVAIIKKEIPLVPAT